MKSKLFLAAICFAALLSKNIQGMEAPAAAPAKASLQKVLETLPPDLQRILGSYIFSGTAWEAGAVIRQEAKRDLETSRRMNSEEQTFALIQFLGRIKNLSLEDAAVALGTIGAEKWLATQIESLKGATEELSRLARKLLEEKEKIGPGSRYVELAARALRAYDSKDEYPNDLLRITKLAVKIKAHELYPVILDKIQHMKRAFSITENSMVTCMALVILGDLETAVPSGDPLAQKLAAYFQELKPRLRLLARNAKNFSEAAKECSEPEEEVAP